MCDSRKRYEYNAFGKPVKKYRDGVLDRVWLWNGDELLAEFDGNNQRIADYQYAGVDRPYAVDLGATSQTGNQYHVQDELGNVIGTINIGTVTQTISYDPWGMPTYSGDMSSRLMWKGLLWEGGPAQGDVVGLYYMRGRWYDPQAGRFIQEDPLGVDGGINIYAFAGDDPVNGFDPSGLDAYSDCSAAAYGRFQQSIMTAIIQQDTRKATDLEQQLYTAIKSCMSSQPLTLPPTQISGRPNNYSTDPILATLMMASNGQGVGFGGGGHLPPSGSKFLSARCIMSGAEFGLALTEDATLGPELLAAEGLAGAADVFLTEGVLHLEVSSVPLMAGSTARNSVATVAHTMGHFTTHWVGEVSVGNFVAQAKGESYFTRETALTLVPYLNLITARNAYHDCF